MPQDIPVEASELLAFTPASFENLDPKPIFMLRAATERDQRFHTRLYDENGIVGHGQEEIREEILAGLKAMWTEEQFAEHAPRVKALWEAIDDHRLATALDPETPWEFDGDEEVRLNELIERVRQSWPPLRRIKADQREIGRLMVPLMLAVIVKDWKGVEVKRELDRGYLTVDCGIALVKAIERLAIDNGINALTPASELFVAATNRMNLTEDEAKNSASPSPSETTQAPSTPDTEPKKAGKSPASARSKKTRESA